MTKPRTIQVPTAVEPPAVETPTVSRPAEQLSAGAGGRPAAAHDPEVNRVADVDHDPERAGDERRRQSRFQQLDRVLVLSGSHRRWAEVSDESLGGIGLTMSDVQGLHPRGRVTLLYQGVPMAARVVRIAPAGDQFRVGLSWVRTTSRLERLLTACQRLLGGPRPRND